MSFWASQSKDRAYVNNVVNWYRRALDRGLAAPGDVRSSSGQSSVEFEADLGKTFNRGYRTYFPYGSDEACGAIDSPMACRAHGHSALRPAGGSV